MRKLKQSITKSRKTKLNNLDRQTAKISALSSRIVSKYEFLTGKDNLPEKDLLEKSPALKRFEYSPLGKDLKKQTSFSEKHYQKLESNKKEEKIKRSRAKSKSSL